MPIVHCIILMLGFAALYAPFMDNLWYLPFGIIFIAVYALVLSPIMSISYCKNLCDMGWKKYLCCIYNAIMTGMYISIGAVLGILETTRCLTLKLILLSLFAFPSFTVFISALLCGLITLRVYDVKKRKTEDGSLF